MPLKGSKLPFAVTAGLIAVGAALAHSSPVHRTGLPLFSGPVESNTAFAKAPPAPHTPGTDASADTTEIARAIPDTEIATAPVPAVAVAASAPEKPVLASLHPFGVLEAFQSLTTPPTPPGGTRAARALPALVELEPEVRNVSLVQPHSDSELEDRASRPIQHVVQVDKGDTLMDLLLRAGVARNEALNAIAALREVYNPRSLRVGQEITVTFERPADGIGAGPFQGITLQPEADRQITARRQADGFAAKEIKHKVTRELARFSGTIRTTLFQAAHEAGISVSTLVEMIHALSYDVDFQRDLQPGDSFEVMFERFADKQGNPVRDGDILYASVTVSGNTVAIYRYVDEKGRADYYDAKGSAVRKALLRTPVDGARLSSGYGARKHPVLGYTKMHKGVDFAAPTGTPIYAAGDGVIEKAGANGSYGYYIRVRHSDKYSTAYAHLSRFAQGIRAGKEIHQGQVIGYVGSTGRSTGPHLHYEILVDGHHVNPLSVKFAGGTTLDPKELPRFLATVKETDRTYADLPESSKVASAAARATKPN